MRIERSHAHSMGGGPGKGYILFGNRPDNDKWLERWYPSIEKAKQFCQKKGWSFRDLTLNPGFDS